MREAAPTAGLPSLDNNPLLDLAMQPWHLASAPHEFYLAWYRSWARLCLCPAYPPHPHEAPEQLEVPDPIAVEGEDLFA